MNENNTPPVHLVQFSQGILADATDMSRQTDAHPDHEPDLAALYGERPMPVVDEAALQAEAECLEAERIEAERVEAERLEAESKGNGATTKKK